MKVEIFTAGCKFCTSVESQVREIISDQHEVEVYNLNDENQSQEYYEAANKYGINLLPSVVVDGKLLGCCKTNGFDKTLLLSSLN